MKKGIAYTLIFLVIIVLGGTGYYLFGKGEKQIEYITVAAARGSLKQTVEATGSVTSAEELNLSFKSSGKIKEINVRVGDDVIAETVLATIADISLSSQVDYADAALLSAQANLDQLLAGAATEEIAVYRKKVDAAEVELDSTKSSLANIRVSQIETRRVYIDTSLQALSDSSFVISFTLDTIYDGILDNEADVDFDTTDLTALGKADSFHGLARQSLQRAKVDLAIATNNGSVNDTLKALIGFRLALDNTSLALDEGFNALAGAIANPSKFSQAQIDNLKSSFNTRAAALSAEKTSIQDSITDLTRDLQDMESNLDAAIFNVKVAESALKLAEAQYDEIVAEPREYEINKQQAKVLQAQADLRSARSKVSDTVIIAPSDGTITAVELEQGEVAVANQTVISMISDHKLQIDVDIPESDINKVGLEFPVTITLDALGHDRVFGGQVTFIEPSETLIQDVVYYRVTVLFTEEQTEVRPGMTADIIISTAERSDVILLPVRAVVIGNDGSKTVRVLESGQVMTRVVTTGLRGDDGQMEILSGLSEGEVVITGEANSK
jgi:RND family efflux transporter MFP subunit